MPGDACGLHVGGLLMPSEAMRGGVGVSVVWPSLLAVFTFSHSAFAGLV